MEFTAADIFQHSPFGDILNALKSLSLPGEPWPDYGQQGWDTDDEEIQSPHTTHFVATADDLTDMLDFDSKDIDDIDADAGDDQEPAPIGHWKATSSYDIYMVDTPKEGNGDGTAEDDPSKKQPKRRRQRRRSKCRQSKNGDSGTGDNNTPDSAEDNHLHHMRMEKPALMRERQTERSRTIIICLPPKTRQASTTTNLLCRRIPSNKSISNAGLWPWRAASRKNSNIFKLIKTYWPTDGPRSSGRRV